MDKDIRQTIAQEFTSYPKRVYPKGQMILFADEDPKHVFYITTGKVRMFAITYRGDEIIANIFSNGAFFPMAWVINELPNTYFYKAEVDTTVHLVPPQKVLAFLREHPDALMDLLSRLYRGVDGILGRMIHLMSGTAKSRLSYELVIEARRFGEKLADGTIRLTVTEQDLAARAGMSRETISREIQKLKASGCLELNRHGGIVVLDLASLNRAASDES